MPPISPQIYFQLQPFSRFMPSSFSVSSVRVMDGPLSLIGGSAKTEQFPCQKAGISGAERSERLTRPNDAKRDYCGTTPSRPTLMRAVCSVPSANLSARVIATWTPGFSSLLSLGM
jgi:hypothetical protein